MAEPNNTEYEWRRQIYRVPMQLRLKKQQQYVYDPMIISIGPYHHGKPHLLQTEIFKREIVTPFMLSGRIQNEGDEMGIFYGMIYQRINQIRSCYVGVMAEELDDVRLAEIIFHDSCFIMYFMLVMVSDEKANQHFFGHLGVLTVTLINPELNMLENQIPFWVIKMFVCTKFGEDDGKSLIRKHFGYANFGDVNKLIKLPWEEEGEEEPLHLLEASQRILALQEIHQHKQKQQQGITKSSSLWNRLKKKSLTREREIYGGQSPQETIESIRKLSNQFYCVTDLKKKGIHLRPSAGRSLKDVSFTSHAFYGDLQLPIWFVSSLNYVYLPNMIAFEMSPGSNNLLLMTSFVNLMKTLIESVDDVQELREKEILFSNLGNDAEIVKLFQEIDTMGMGTDLYHELKMEIQMHCSSRAKTWMAELAFTYFRSPWTIIALLAATFLIVLTFLQTYYTIRPL